jgi:hypothetical protein
MHGEKIMPSPAVVVAQKDPSITLQLANELHAHFSRIVVANDPLELRTLLLRHQAKVAVVDLELVNPEDIRQLAHAFFNLTIVCTHRAPDERMWMTALGAGAVELCCPQDVRSILRASRTAIKPPLTVAA